MNVKYPTKVTINDFELLDFGIIDLWYKEFIIEVAGLKLVFSFDDTKDDDPKLHMAGSIVEGNTLKFNIRNMSNVLGDGFFEPIELGTIDNKKFFITFSAWTFDINKNIRTVVYNLLLK